MQTKFYFLLAALVGFSSVSGKLVAQTACYDYGAQPADHPGFELSVEELATFGADASGALSGLAGMTTYRVYLNTPDAGDYVSSVLSGGDGGTVALSTTGLFYQHQYGGNTSNLINPALFGFFPALEFDSWVTIGLTGQPTSGQQGVSLQAESAWAADFANGSSFSVGGAIDGGWFINGGSNGYAGDDQKVLLAQLTTDGDLGGALNVTIQAAAGGTFTHQFTFSSEICGCTDPASPSYVEEATINDGSCIYLGCTDNTACNFDSGATDEDGSCDYCCNALTSDTEGYGIDVELHAVGGVVGMRTYRVYATTANPGDALSAVAGLETSPLEMATTTSFYQHPQGAATSQPLNPLFFPTFPEMEYDSFVTIGLTGPAGTGENATQLANTPGEDWATTFEAGGNISISTLTGGAWFAQPGGSNAIAGDDNRVLIGQFTTDGYLSGTALIQVFPYGVQEDEIQYVASFSTPMCACTDESACNYDENALWDDGTCQYPIDVYGVDYVDCDENCLNDSDGDFVCDEDEIVGCMVEGACNYVMGATDIVPCVWPTAGYDCEGNCLADADGDGVCDMYEVVDCTDATACNYNSDSTTDTDNSLCLYPDAGYTCDGSCVNDADMDGVCDEFEVGGCTEADACNFDSGATDNDGSCDYCCYSTTEVDGYFVSIEEHATSEYGTTYRMYVNTDDATDLVSAISGTSEFPTMINTTTSFFQGTLSPSPFPTYLMPAFFGVYPELAYDSWVTLGVESSILPAGYGSPQLASTTDWAEVFQAGGNIDLTSTLGDSWFVTADYDNGVAGDDHRVLVGQFTTTGMLSGQLYVQIFDQGDQGVDQRVTLPFNYMTEDTEAPTFTSVPADAAMACDSDLPTEMAVAVDGGCGLPVVVTYEDAIESMMGTFVVTRTFTATDAAGNTATAVQTLTLVDEVAPVAVAPANVTVECAEGIDPSVTGEPTASTDNCDGELSWTYEDAPLGNSASLNGVTLDLNASYGLNLPGLFGQPYVVSAEGVTVGSGLEMSADDVVSNPVSHRGLFEVDIDGSTITLTVTGTVTGAYAYDYATLTIDNAAGFDFGAISVVSNGIAPNAELSATSSNGALVISFSGNAVYTEGATASFEVANQVTCLASNGVLRTWTVSDDAGNTDTATQTITIVDTQGPEFVDFPADVTVSCSDDMSLATPEAMDCEGSAAVSVVETIMPGACPNNYTIVRTFTAVDGCSNISVRSHSMTVVDNEAPVFTSVPEDVTLEIGESLPTALAQATDNCSEPTITYSDVPVVGDLATTITRTFTATDACGNTAFASQAIVVNEILGCTDALACNYDMTATYEDGSCDYCSCGNTAGGQNGFGLELELHAENGIPGLNTYRVYVTTPSPTDFVSAIAGDEVVPTFLNTTTSFHQEQFGSYSAASINPLFFGFMPSLQYDSWLTMGIESLPAAGQSEITFVQAQGDSWIASFEQGNNLDISSFFGGSWFTLPTFSNGYAGEDQRVLVAQLTTDGEVSGQMFVQVFPNGVGADAEYLTLSFGTNSCGCLNESACNYDASATYSNEAECVFPEDIFGNSFVDCDGVCLNDADGDGICDEDEVPGCTDDTACNYDLGATDNDGSCFFTEDCSGCTDALACNYAPNAVTDNGSCTYADFGYDCDGNCLDQNSDLICDALQGCNDATACNYDPTAEQPSQDFCDYCSCPILFSSDDEYGIEIEEVAVDGIPGMSTYRVYVTTANPTDRLNALLGNDLNPIVLASSSQFFQDIYGTEFRPNAALFASFPTLEYDSWVTIGENTPVSSIQVPTQLGGSDPEWIGTFESGSDIVIDDVVGSGWYLSAETSDAYGVAGDDNRVLVAQLTTPGTLNIQLYAQIFPEGLAAGSTKYVSMSWGSPYCACTDEMACNYDEEAVTDDGNCYYVTNEASCDDVCLFDNSSPVIESVEHYTTTCEAIQTEYVFPVASDNCDSELDFDFVDVVTPGSCPNSYSIVRTWTVTDNVGYSASIVQNITVEDITGPTFTVPADATIACGADATDLTLTGDVTDLMDGCGSATIDYSDAAGEDICFAGDVIIRTWTAEDECGNTTTATQTITIVDEVEPVFTSVPADVSIACGDAIPTDMAEATDACSDVTVTVSESAGETNCTGMAAVIRTFTATDGCGNTTIATQTVTYADTEAPTFTAPADASVECGADASIAAMGEPADLADNCMSELTVSHEDVIETSADGCFADDVIRRTWTVTDGCGNAASAVQFIQFIDTTAPEMEAVAETIELGCGEALPTDLPAATDGCSAVTVDYIDVNSSMSCTGAMNILRTFTATDACGNSTSSTQSIVFTDDIAPTFTAPADVTLECGTDLSDLSLTGEVTDAADICSADIELTYEDAVSTSEGACFNDNIITRTWTATDGCGNFSQDVQIITLEDNTAPEVIGSDEISLVYYTDQALPQLVELEVIEDCSEYSIETEDTYAASGVYGFELSRVYTITDACGNSTTFNQHVLVTFYAGCTYADAVNYDDTALVDDGSCIYEGCTDSSAANYNPVAGQDDGSCVIVGCMDPEGLDYDVNANYPGGCDYPDPCPADLDENGEVNVNDLLEFFQFYGTSCN